MKKLLFLIALVATVAMFSSCATITCGSNHSINISSTPSGAVIYDNGEPIGQTPFTAVLPKKDQHTITIWLEGYQPYGVMLRRRFNVAYLGNIIFGGIIGLIIDGGNGAIYNLSPDQIHVEFGDAVSSSGKTDEIYISTTLEPDPE